MAVPMPPHSGLLKVMPIQPVSTAAFTKPGTGTHFWLKEGLLTPLLTYATEHDEFVLYGKTFARVETGNQWCPDRFELRWCRRHVG